MFYYFRIVKKIAAYIAITLTLFITAGSFYYYARTIYTMSSPLIPADVGHNIARPFLIAGCIGVPVTFVSVYALRRHMYTLTILLGILILLMEYLMAIFHR